MDSEGPRPPFVLPPRIALLRSLRIKVLLVVAVVAMAPQLLVALWSTMERNIAGEMTVRVGYTASEVAEAIGAKSTIDGGAVIAIDEIAHSHGLRVRVFQEGFAIVDADSDRGTDLVHQIGMLFFGPDGAPSLDELDATLGPIDARREVLDAVAKGTSAGCRTSQGGKLLVCHGVQVIHGSAGKDSIIYVQESSRRAVRALYDLRYQLARLSIITLPLALALAYWMGKRVVGPIEQLRGQALASAGVVGSLGPVAPPSALVVPGQDEITDLAAAFNSLLRKLQHRQGENERFVADLVHELKNPVAAVRAAAEALISSEGSVEEARAKRLGKVLVDSSARLDALVSQLLELARAEAGLASDERAEVDLAALARGLVDSIRARYEAVEITVEAPPEAKVQGVPHGLDTLLRNLIENAASFALPAGDAPARVVVQVIPDGASVRVRVTDSGPGIPAEALSRVFTRFFTTRGRARGTGLGLALVRAVAEAHGGEVHVTSEPGCGATFEVVLPRIPGG